MSRRVAAVLLSGALLSGCGTGLEAQTYKETGRSDGTSADLETLAVRNLHVEAPTSGGSLEAGGSAVLTGALINHGSSADTLTSVSSNSAGTVSLTDKGKPVTSIAVPAGGAASTWTAVLQGLTARIPSGSYITVTLTFTSAGKTTLQVPVQIGAGDLGSREVRQDPKGEPTQPAGEGG